MVRFENAKVIEAEELKEIIEEEFTNPTVDRLMFIETKAKGDIPGKVFPCYLEAWGEADHAVMKVDPSLVFQVCITQSFDGEFSMVRVYIHTNELGATKRIWDKPPSKGLSENTPWAQLEEGVQ